MFKRIFKYSLIFASAGFALMWAGCAKSAPTPAASNASAPSVAVAADSAVAAESSAAPATAPTTEDHGHKPGEHGGNIVSLGRDSYHVEAIVTNNGELQLYTLGADESRVQDVELQDLIAYVKREGAGDSASIEVKPRPQPGDAKGKSSLFVAQLPTELVGQNIEVTVPNITIAGDRFRLGFTSATKAHGEEAMPEKVTSDEERELYLTAGGVYTDADIEANGKVTASQKFKDFMSAHDMHPKTGDKICPVTMTKANPKCAWIVGGKTYEFCCPPCVDEFVKLAKSEPDKIKQPQDYIQR